MQQYLFCVFGVLLSLPLLRTLYQVVFIMLRHDIGETNAASVRNQTCVLMYS